MVLLQKNSKNLLFSADESEQNIILNVYLPSFIKSKMNLNLKKIICAVGMFAFFNQSFAQGVANAYSREQLIASINTITTAVPFLLIAPDARAGGMGDYGVATSPDAASSHWNPAKLAFADKKIGISISYTPWLRALVNDINLGYVSAYTKLPKDQAVSFSMLYFSLGSIDFTNDQAEKTGSFDPKEYAFDLSYARKLGEKISGAISLRYIYSNLTGNAFIQSGNIQTKPGQTAAADIAAFYRTDVELGGKKSQLGIGIDISNIGGKISYSTTAAKDFIPMNFRIGTNLKMDLDQYNSLSFGVDFNKLLVPTPPVYAKDSLGNYIYDSDQNRVIEYGKDPTNVSVASAIFSSWGDAPGGFSEELNEFTYSIGAEYWYDKQFAIRAGYFNEAKTKGNRKFFTLGAGLRYNVFGLDFAYLIPTTQRNPLENTLRFTLSFDLDGLKSQKKSDE